MNRYVVTWQVFGTRGNTHATLSERLLLNSLQILDEKRNWNRS